jgi:membrane-associated phospholipid phosphatase
MKLRAGVLAAVLLLGGSPRSVCAQQAAPNTQRSSVYYFGNGALTLALSGAGLLFAGFTPEEPRLEASWFPGDRSARGVYAPAAARLSDVLLVLSVVDPLMANVAQGVNWRFANFSVVYSETLAINLALNTLAKVTVARPRPYTYKHATAPDDADRYVSFYSGHSSTSFAAAVSGSYLFAENAPDQASRYVLWSSEFFLAALTANLRVRAGKHYYSDILVGALAGSGIGVATLLLHGATYQPTGAEYAAAGGGVLVGTALAHVLPFELGRPSPSSAWLDSFTLSPWSLGRDALGVQAEGSF